jgi:hydroxyacylglutathione hydrolase
LILCTHHHWDHVDGNLELQQATACEIACSSYDLKRVPGATRGLADGETIALGESRLRAIAIPGHTLGHMALYCEGAGTAGSGCGAVFAGDTVFAFGAGRLFEGTAAQLRQSLARLAALPAQTRLYYGHEYAERNAAFALGLMPHDAQARARWERLRAGLEKGELGTPGILADELATNPFFRVEGQAYRDRIGLGDKDATVALAELRARRDQW